MSNWWSVIPVMLFRSASTHPVIARAAFAMRWMEGGKGHKGRALTQQPPQPCSCTASRHAGACTMHAATHFLSHDETREEIERNYWMTSRGPKRKQPLQVSSGLPMKWA